MPSDSSELLTPPAPSARPGWRALLVDAGCLALLLVAGWKLVHGLERVLDLGMWDEAQYLRSGLALSTQPLPDPEWGPLYSLWYYGLSYAWPDPVALYYANHRLLLLLTVAGAYVCMRRMGARHVLSLLGASIYLLSLAPHILPRPTLLALLVVLLALFLASFQRAEGFWAVMAVGGLVASFARPEFFVVFLLLTGLLLVLLGRRVLREGRAALPRAGALAASVGLALLVLTQAMGNPFGNTSNRRFYAFCQHFAVNYVARTGIPVEPWGDCDQVIQSVFGKVDTLGAAARSNPAEFLAHLRDNVAGYFVASVRLFFHGYGGTSPLWGAWTVERVGRLLLLAAVAWQGALLLRRWRRVVPAMADPRLQRLAGVLLAVEAPIVLSAVLIFPREHYLVAQGVLAGAFLAALGSRVAPEGSRSREWGLGLAFALGLVVLTPDLSRRPPTSAGLKHLEVVRDIASRGLTERLGPGETLDVLEAQGGYDTYLGRRYRRVSQGLKQEPFGEFLRKRGVELIVLDDKLRGDRRFIGDPEFLAFERNPEAFGFSRVPLSPPGTALAFPRAWGERATPSSSMTPRP